LKRRSQIQGEKRKGENRISEEWSHRTTEFSFSENEKLASCGRRRSGMHAMKGKKQARVGGKKWSIFEIMDAWVKVNGS